MRILLVEDVRPALEQLRELLIETFPFAVVDAAPTVSAGLRLLDLAIEADTSYDVAILDSSLPRDEGLSAEIDESLCLLLRARFPGTYVIHVTAYETNPLVVKHLFQHHLEPGDPRASLCCKNNVAWVIHLIGKIKAVLVGNVSTEGDDEVGETPQPDRDLSAGFDVFLCHNSEDKPAVRKLAQRLRTKGLHPWLDVEQLRPGVPWQATLEEQIGSIRSAAVFIGQSGIGPWQNLELRAFLSEFVVRRCPVIPVILADCPTTPHIPIFLREMTWVDFRVRNSIPMRRLMWGITGKRR